VELVTLKGEVFDGVKAHLVHRVTGLGQANQDIRINEVVHSPRPE
jgi:hypothetical protein